MKNFNKIRLSLKSLFFSEITLLAVCILIIFAMSFYYLYYYVSTTPKGLFFPLIHNYTQDYYYYLSMIKQSFDGRWLLITRYSPENFSAQFIYFIFILLGKAAALTGLSLPVVYTLSRFVFGSLLIVSTYFLIRLAYPKNPGLRKLAVILAVFGTGFAVIQMTKDGLSVSRYLVFWTEINPVEHFAYIPHHLAGKLFAVASLVLLAAFLEKNNIILFILSCLSGFLSGLSSPYVLVNLAFTVTLFTPLAVYLHRKEKHTVRKLITFIPAYLILTAASLLYLKYVERSGFPWSIYINWEKQTFPISFADYFLSLGPAFIFSLIAVPYLLKGKKLIHLLLVAWLFEPWIGIYLVSPFVSLQNVRFLAFSHFIPVGILASYGMVITGQKLEKFIRLKWWLFSGAFLLIFLFFSAANFYSNIAEQLKAFSPVYYNIYLPEETLSSFTLLDTSTPYESTVLAGSFMSTIIPAFSHNKTFLGHYQATYQYGEKQADVTKFFEQSDAVFAKNLMYRYQVKYVYFGPDTPPPNDSFLADIGLAKMYSNSRIIIYKKI